MMTLHYEFPIIRHIDDVLPFIKDDRAFIVAKRDWGTVVNYTMAGNNTFPTVTDKASAIRRECRGMIFDLNGKLIARRYHKFFNLGEREDLMSIDISKPHVIMNKLDGSMVTPIKLADGSIRWGTKMGITDVSMQAEVFVASRPLYEKFSQDYIDLGYTPIFEWISRKQRIVIDYPEDNLILTAVRDNDSGRYLNYNQLNTIRIIFRIPVVDVLKPIDDLNNFVEKLRKREDIEGVVLRFDDGHMVKIKTDAYVSLHRAKSLLDNERDVIELVLDQKEDDLIALLNEDDKKRLNNYARNVWDDVMGFVFLINSHLQLIKTLGTHRKDFAISSETMIPLLRSAVFANWDKEFCESVYVIHTIKQHLGSKARFERLRDILKTAVWKETHE